MQVAQVVGISPACKKKKKEEEEEVSSANNRYDIFITPKCLDPKEKHERRPHQQFRIAFYLKPQ